MDQGQPEPKRFRIEVEADSSHSLQPAPVTPLVPDSNDAIDESDDAEIDDCIFVSNSPILPARSNSRDVIDLSRSPSPEPAPQISQRQSFMASAKALLSRVPIFRSPTTSMQPLGQTVEVDQKKAVQPLASTSGQKSTSQRGDRSRTPAEFSQTSEESQSKQFPTAANRRRQKKKIRAMGRSASTEAVPKVETPVGSDMAMAPSAGDDEEDELLLSPESARKRRREEEGEIAWSQPRGEWCRFA